MRKSPVFIALAAAGVIAVAHTAIAAIGNADVIEPAVAASVQQPAAGAEAKVINVLQVPQPAVLAAAPMMDPAGVGTGVRSQAKAAIRTGELRANAAGTTFPSAAIEYPEPLPAAAQYFDRNHPTVVTTGARDPVFPSAAVELPEPLPAVVAYFERMENEQRLAADAATARVTRYVDSMSQKVAANTARESVTAYVESLSQKLALAPAPAVAMREPPLRTVR
jgi:hypothetical protein